MNGLDSAASTGCKRAQNWVWQWKTCTTVLGKPPQECSSQLTSSSVLLSISRAMSDSACRPYFSHCRE